MRAELVEFRKLNKSYMYSKYSIKPSELDFAQTNKKSEEFPNVNLRFRTKSPKQLDPYNKTHQRTNAEWQRRNL